MALDEQIIGGLNTYAGNANVQVGGNQPYVMNVPQQAYDKLASVTENYFKEKKEEKDKWEQNVSDKIASISKMDGVFAKDIPMLAEEKKKLIQYIKENAYLLSPANQMKNPEKYSELESMVTDYLAKVDKSKADNLIAKEYSVAMRKPEYSNTVMQGMFEEFSNTPLMERESFGLIADPSNFEKEIEGIYRQSGESSIEQSVTDYGVSSQEVIKVDPNKFLETITSDPRYNQYFLHEYKYLKPERKQQLLDEKGIDNAQDYLEYMAKNRLPLNNKYKVGKPIFRANDVYKTENQNEQKALDREVKRDIATERNRTQKEIADARLAYLKEKQSISGNGNFDKINQVFSAVDKLAELGQVEQGDDGSDIYKISPNDVDSNIQAALYAGGQSAHGDAYGIVYRSTLPNGAIVYRPAKVQYIDKRNGKEATKDRYKNNPAAFTTSVVPDMNDGNAFTEEQLVNRLATREQGTRIQYDKWLQMNGKQTTQASGSQPSATSGALTNENILGSINKIKGGKYEMGAKGEGGKYDCSGFVCKVLNDNGVSVSGTSEELITKAPTIIPSASQAQVGDVIGIDTGERKHDKGRESGIDHVGIVIEKNGTLYLAEQTSKGFIETPLDKKVDNLISKNHSFWIGRYNGQQLSSPRKITTKTQNQSVSSQSTAKPKKSAKDLLKEVNM